MAQSHTTAAAPARDARHLLLVGLMFVGFISLGLPDGLLGVAWPSMAASRGVSLDALGMLLAAASAGFIAASVFSGRLIARLGVGGLLAAASLTTALSLLGFALAPTWWMLLPMAMLLGAGGGCIDGGLNNYAAATTSPRVLTWLHGFYGVGATAGPLLMTALLTGGQPWQNGYLAVGLGQLALALCFALTRGRWAAHAPAEAHAVRSAVGLRATLALPAVWLSALLFVLYTGLEVSAGQWAYTLFTVGRGVDPALAGQWVALYWGGLTAGRFVAGAVARRLTPRALLWIGSIGAAVGAAMLGLLAAPWASAMGMVLMGFALAPIFPALIGTTAERVGGAHAANAIGLQVASANIGAAGIPWLIGLVAAGAGIPAIGPAVVVVAAVYMALFVAAMARRPRGA
ncbi:MAG TPA: MFS transporter [Chloroflexaceae bacterium]|nr:MFS transporter [Chloroflexaceae bacterium]